MAKQQAVTGVPNKAENNPLIPHITARCISFSSRRITEPTAEPRLPPSCKAAPSLPAEPPKRWVTAVLKNISGAIIHGTFSFVLTDCITILVPGSFSRPHIL